MKFNNNYQDTNISFPGNVDTSMITSLRALLIQIMINSLFLFCQASRSTISIEFILCQN